MEKKSGKTGYGEQRWTVRASLKLFPVCICLCAVLLVLAGCARYEDDRTINKIASIMMYEDSRNPDPMLSSFAQDKDPAIRKRAALAIGRIGNPKLLGTLEKLIEDPDAGVRATACFALGITEAFRPSGSAPSVGIIDAGERARLVARFLDDKDPGVRSAATDAICRLQYEPLAARILERLSDSEEPVIGATLLSVWKLKNEQIKDSAMDRVTDKVIEISRSDDIELRWKAAYCLMRLSDPRSFDRLAELSRDRSPLIRSLVARALEKIDDPRLAEILINLCNDTDWNVAVTALRTAAAKGKLLKQESISHLLESTNQHVALLALNAIPLLDGDKTETLTTRFLDAQKPYFRSAAIAALSNIPAGRFLKIAERMVSDDDWGVRAAAADALGSVQDERSVPLILTLIDDNDERVIPHAISALMKHYPENPIASINHLFLKKDFVIRATAISEIARLFFDEEDGNNTLNKQYSDDLKGTFLEIAKASYDIAASDNEPDAKLEILNAAARLFKKNDAAALIISALNDSDYIVRRRAAEILREKKGEDHFDEILPAVSGRTTEWYASASDYAKNVRGAVIKTEKGDIAIEFYQYDAPLTVHNFCDLAERGFYDGKSFHRVVSNFVVQDGCPRGDGWGSPGYQIRCELTPIDYMVGSLGMAHSGKDTGGSQFFITHSPQPHLTGKYTIFGKVTSGMDAVDSIMPGDTIVSIEVMR